MSSDGACVAASVDKIPGQSLRSDDENAERQAQELPALCNEIYRRRAACEFCLLRPSEQCFLQEDDAADMLTWLRKVDYVKLQAYMDDQWQLFRSSSPSDANISEGRRRALWEVDTYYKHLRDFDAELIEICSGNRQSLIRSKPPKNKICWKM